MELSQGDETRINEVKGWLKEGVRITEVRERLEKLGYSPYHISFLLEQATGQKFMPSKPKVLVDTKNIRIAMIVATVVLLLGLVIWLVPGVLPW